MSTISPSPTARDADLVEQAREGSPAAFAELVRRHHAAVRVFLARLVGELHAADDLAQDAFLAAYQNLSRHQADHEFLHWVFGIARHKAISYLRQRIRRRRHEGQPLASVLDQARLVRAETASDDPAHDDWLPRLRGCLQRLAPHSRWLIEQHYFQGQSTSALAALQGKRGGAVRMALLRIRQTLHKCLARHQEEE